MLQLKASQTIGPVAVAPHTAQVPGEGELCQLLRQVALLREQVPQPRKVLRSHRRRRASVEAARRWRPHSVAEACIITLLDLFSKAFSKVTRQW